MTLPRYLKLTGESQTSFAKRAKVERATITRVLSGKRARFSVDVALKIEKATGGKVSFEEALGLGPKKAA